MDDSTPPAVQELLQDEVAAVWRASLARAVVEVREHLDGSLSVWRQGQRLMTTAAPEDAPRVRARGGPRPPVGSLPVSVLLPDVLRAEDIREQAPLAPPRQGPSRPAASHPWRTSITTKRTVSQNSERS